VSGNGCLVPANAGAYVLNAIAMPPAALGCYAYASTRRIFFSTSLAISRRYGL